MPHTQIWFFLAQPRVAQVGLSVVSGGDKPEALLIR